MKRAREQSLYDQSLSVPQIRGDDLKIDSLKGKVVLVVNTASH
jgi:glutathione peroxidase-family protein